MLDETQTERRLTLLEERAARMAVDMKDADVTASRFVILETRFSALLESHQRLMRIVEGMDADARKLMWSALMVTAGIAAQYLAGKLGV